jgi:uncharacterized protein YdiU (UPF0061 family)
MRFRSNALTTSVSDYSRFDLINGEHPYKQLGTHGYVEYEVMKLNKGKVVYFNFELAKEMGLVANNHSSEMTTELHEKLIEIFSIQIINEYDILNKKRVAKKNLKPNKFMATRYLQLQHKSKTGLTSGDGRSIWNGFIEHKGTAWDISSRGTGVTILSPGASKKNKPLKTGNTETGYGCGQAEIDELIGSAIMSEVLHHKGVHTERVLCVIDLGKGVGIGVRAGNNLIRPAHAFLYLKQNKLPELKKVIDYHIDRQQQNNKINKLPRLTENQKYDYFLNNFTEDLARFTAFIEENYIFVWLDWDGDNLLMDSGIIDYGSIRHFGTCHNRYKYDDVDRFSTNLTEQKQKARFLVKEMIQVVEYLKTGNKQPLGEISSHAILQKFDSSLKKYALTFFAEKIGLSAEHIKKCFADKNLYTQLRKLKNIFYYWENLKTSKGKEDVPDGINYFPLANMRAVARELPSLIYNNDSFTIEDFCKLAQTQFCKPRDEKIFYKNKKQFNALLANYKNLFKELILFNSEMAQEKLKQRLNQIHPENFLTGNSLIHCVDDIITAYATSENTSVVQNSIEKLVHYSQGQTYFNRQRHFYSLTNEDSLLEKRLWDKIIMNLHEFREDI